MLVIGLILLVAGIAVALSPVQTRVKWPLGTACVLAGIELVLLDLLSGPIRPAVCIPLGVLFASLVGLMIALGWPPGVDSRDRRRTIEAIAPPRPTGTRVSFQVVGNGGAPGHPSAALLGEPGSSLEDGVQVCVVAFAVHNSEGAATMRVDAEAASILDLRLMAGTAALAEPAIASHELLAGFRAAVMVRAPIAASYRAEVRTDRQELVQMKVAFTPAKPQTGGISWLRSRSLPDIRIRRPQSVV